MCWVTDFGEHTKPLISDKDIKVIKFFDINGHDLLSSILKTKYKIGKAMPKIHIKCKQNGWFNEREINEGYHSYQYGNLYARPNPWNCGGIFINIQYCNRETVNIDTVLNDDLSRIPYECIIPKGTKYYVNEYHEIVSETIIVKEPAETFDNGYI